MNNPCEQCIVRAMCKNPCDTYLVVIEAFLHEIDYWETTEDIKYVARSLRTGGMKIVDNELQYKSIIDEFIYRWSKGNRQWINIGYKEF